MHMTNGEWINLAAILLGPILAVLVTRFIDSRRETQSRRMEIFKTLMRTRRTPTYADHVGALNLIEVEYPCRWTPTKNILVQTTCASDSWLQCCANG